MRTLDIPIWFPHHRDPDGGCNGPHIIDEETEVQRGTILTKVPRPGRGQSHASSPDLSPPNLFPLHSAHLHCVGNGGCCPSRRSLRDIRPGFLMRHLSCRELLRVTTTRTTCIFFFLVVSQGCRKKQLQTRGLEQQKCILSQSTGQSLGALGEGPSHLFQLLGLQAPLGYGSIPPALPPSSPLTCGLALCTFSPSASFKDNRHWI